MASTLFHDGTMRWPPDGRSWQISLQKRTINDTLFKEENTAKNELF